jgi:hypothetical protein
VPADAGTQARVKRDLGSVKRDLESVKRDLGSVKRDLGSVKRDLGSVKRDLGSVKRDLPAGMSSCFATVTSRDLYLHFLFHFYFQDAQHLVPSFVAY